MMQANEIIVQLEDSNFWLKTDKVIEYSQDQKTLFFAYSALQKGIKLRWSLLGPEQKQGMRFYIENLLTNQLQQQNNGNRNDNIIRKINSIMVEIIKKELNNSWPTALTDLAQASYKSQVYCQNILLIFKELSVEVFDFWENSLTQQEFNKLKEKLQESFKAIYDVFIFVLQSYLSNSQQISYQLVYTCLETLEVYCSWIPIGYIIMDPLPQYLAEMASKKQFVHISLKCIEQIFSVNLVDDLKSLSQEELNKCQQDFFNFYSNFLQKFQIIYNCKTNFQLARNQIISNSDNTVMLNQFDILCQNLSLTINAFFQTHLDWIIKKNFNNSNNEGIIFNLSVGIEYMAQLTISGDQSTLKTCVEFFSFLTDYFRKIYDGLVNQSGFQQNQNQGLVNIMKKLIQEGPINTAIYNLTLKMPQPQEVQIEIDDDGIPQKRTFVNTSRSSFYNTMKKMFQNFAVLNWQNFQSILQNRLEKQTNNTEFTYDYLNSLCWTIGCIAHQIRGEDEKNFFVVTLRKLLNYIKNKNQMNDKAVIATNIMHIVSQYHNFLKENKEFNRIVVGKLFEFMREKIPGIPEMSCSVFIKLCKSTSASFRQDVKIDKDGKTENNFNFVFNNYKQQIVHLNDQLLIQEFYDSLGVIVAVQSNDELKNNIINEIMTEYTKVVVNAQQNLQNQQYLADLTNTQHLNFALKINHLISQHTKESYYTYFNNAFPNITQLYEAYLNIINQIFQKEGESCLNQVSVKAYRKVRTNILILIENLVKTVNAQNQPQFLQVYNNLIYFSLELYTKEDPLIREPQILSFIGVCLEKFRGQMFDTFAKMIPVILGSVLPMITKDFHSYPEHRENFFKLIQTLVKHCFQIFSQIDQQSFMLIMDCIMWAIKHDLPSTYELGLKTLNSLLREINNNQNMIDSFYQKFYVSMMNDLFYIWSDGLHQNGTQLIAETLFLMFNILGQIKVNLFENQNTDNMQAVYSNIYNTMSGAFDNLSKKDHEKNLKAVMEASQKSSKILEKTLKDYAVSLKIHTVDQLTTNQLYLQQQLAIQILLQIQ